MVPIFVEGDHYFVLSNALPLSGRPQAGPSELAC